MTKVAVWCRHAGDNIIGIGPNIPWHIPSDTRFFRSLVDGQTIVMGRKTYESFYVESLDNLKIIVLSKNNELELRNKAHLLTTDIRFFKEIEEDIYIAGGSEIYKAFLNGGSKLMPDIIVDCVYLGELNDALSGIRTDISDCVLEMKKSYRQISTENELDGVVRTIFIRKGEFIEQAVLKRIVSALETEK